MNKRFIVFLSSRKSWTLPYIIFSAIFVIIPLFLIVVYAFTDDSGHLTLANFQKFFEHPEAINTFVYSIGIAIITTLVCILLGYPAAWILSNSKLNRSKTMVVLFILPMWVNSGAYPCHCCLIRLFQCAFGRGSVDIRYGIQLYPFHDLSYLQHFAEDGS